MSHRVLGPMFHGTSIEAADGILASGSRVSHSGRWGGGFYVTPSPILAGTYARAGSSWDQPPPDEPTVLEGTVDAKNPRHFKDYEEAESYLGERGYKPHEVHRMGELLEEEGHDFFSVGGTNPFGVVLKDGAFHPKRMMEPDWNNQGPWTDLT